jgi:aminoglycoside 3-N-acetyltransferase
LKLIGLLQTALGETGTLAVPTFPFQGKQYDYVRKQRTFNVRRTPSQVGLLTEVFRRMPGVMRSAHPTHPVAAWGKHAIELTSTHHLGPTFGETSPFYKLALFDGRVIGIGTRLESYTILHVADELSDTQRRRVFSEPVRSMITNGTEEVPYEVRPLRPDARRNMTRVEKALLQNGVLTYITVAGLRCSTSKANEFIQASMKLIDEGRFL